MGYSKHSDLLGKHAFLGASKCSWINYDEEQLIQAYNAYLAKERGTRLHALASELIDLNIKLPRSNKTLNLYVNDCIGFKMKTEQVIFYSDNCFGTADAICFRGNELRIHDLKTGKVPAHMEQLYVYAALYCLENRLKPAELIFETRIYQNDEVLVANPDVTIIAPLMDHIMVFDKLINKLKREAK